MLINTTIFAYCCFLIRFLDAQHIIPPEMMREMQCCKWAAQGQCNVNPRYMRVQCQVACGTIGATESNADQFQDNIPDQCTPKNFFFNSTNTEFIDSSTAKQKHLQKLARILSGRRQSKPDRRENKTLPELSFQFDPLTAAVQAGRFTPQTVLPVPNTLTLVPPGSASPLVNVPIPSSSFPSLIPTSGLPNLAIGGIPSFTQLQPVQANPVQTFVIGGSNSTGTADLTKFLQVALAQNQQRSAVPATPNLNLQRTLLAAPNGAFGSGLPLPSQGLPDPNAILLRQLVGSPPPLPLPTNQNSNNAIIQSVLQSLAQTGSTPAANALRIPTSQQSGVTSAATGGGIDPLLLAALLSSSG